MTSLPTRLQAVIISSLETKHNPSNPLRAIDACFRTQKFTNNLMLALYSEFNDYKMTSVTWIVLSFDIHSAHLWLRRSQSWFEWISKQLVTSLVVLTSSQLSSGYVVARGELSGYQKNCCLIILIDTRNTSRNCISRLGVKRLHVVNRYRTIRRFKRKQSNWIVSLFKWLRWREPQLQGAENYWGLPNWRTIILKLTNWF